MCVYCAITGACWLFPGDRDEGSDTLGVEGLSSLGREAEQVVKHPIAVLCEERVHADPELARGAEDLKDTPGCLKSPASGWWVWSMKTTGLVLGIGEGLGGLKDGSGPDPCGLEMVHRLLWCALACPFLR